jgi:hypothetical protein
MPSRKTISACPNAFAAFPGCAANASSPDNTAMSIVRQVVGRPAYRVWWRWQGAERQAVPLSTASRSFL